MADKTYIYNITANTPRLSTKWCHGCEEVISGRYKTCPYCGSTSLVSVRYHIKMLESKHKVYKNKLSLIQNILREGLS